MLSIVSFHLEDKLKHLDKNFNECDIDIDFEHTYICCLYYFHIFICFYICWNKKVSVFYEFNLLKRGK